MSKDMIEADVQSKTAIAVRSNNNALSWVPSFVTAVDEAIERKAEKRRFFEKVMVEGQHYGKIPGTGKDAKPTLLKPGAEMLCANMGLNPSGSDAEPPVRDLLGKDHGGEPYILYRRVCKIYRQIGPHENDRMIVGQAEGLCSSWETKYRYRNGRLTCPSCGKQTIIKQKNFDGNTGPTGWVCWRKEGKSDGCNTKFPPGDMSIASQVVGKVPNPDVAELENTILKMADKRAFVAATLLATGCSDIFTQDLEDNLPDDGQGGAIDAEFTPVNDPPPLTAEEEERVRAQRAIEVTVAKKRHYIRRVIRERAIPDEVVGDRIKAIRKDAGFDDFDDLNVDELNALFAALKPPEVEPAAVAPATAVPAKETPNPAGLEELRAEFQEFLAEYDVDGATIQVEVEKVAKKSGDPDRHLWVTLNLFELASVFAALKTTVKPAA
jgi:hypothetical protein